MKKVSCYTYGVVQTEREKKLGFMGINGREEVYIVCCKGLGAVISDSVLPDFSSLAQEEVVKYLFTHQKVVENVMKEYDIIPFKFGTTVNTTKKVKEILEYGYPKFKDNLNTVKDKVELDVVVTWNKDFVFKNISQEDEIKKFKQKLETRPSMENQIRLGQLVETHLSKKKEQLAPKIINILTEITQDYRFHDTLDATMIANIALLISKQNQYIFDKELNKIDKRYEGRLNFKCVGPLPPYSFSTIELKKVNFEEIERARKLLKLGDETTLSQIKDAYWSLSSKYHPDKHPGDTEVQKRFEDITRAYEFLTEYCQANDKVVCLQTPRVFVKQKKCSFRDRDVREFVKIEIVKMGKEEN